MAAIDSGNKLVPVAFATISKENADGYAFLFREEKKNTEVVTFLDNPATTIFADDHRGSPGAMRAEVPLAR